MLTKLRRNLAARRWGFAYCMLPLVLGLAALGFFALRQLEPDSHSKITAVLKRLFERPASPLNVISITQEGDFALAAWMQGAQGGHAFLRKQQEQWALVICGGGNLTEPEVLRALGMSEQAALRMARAVQLSEQSLASSQRESVNASILGLNHP